MIIQGEKVNIRAIEFEDLEFLREMINSKELEDMENGFNFPISQAQQQRWFENLINHDDPGRFIIESKFGEVIGYASILNIDWKNRSAHTGLKILHDDHRGKGYGADTVKAIMKFCFEELQLNRLEGYIIDYNTESLKLFIDKCNWKREGIKRSAIYKKGSYHDLIMVGILKSEYTG